MLRIGPDVRHRRQQCTMPDQSTRRPEQEAEQACSDRIRKCYSTILLHRAVVHTKASAQRTVATAIKAARTHARYPNTHRVSHPCASVLEPKAL